MKSVSASLEKNRNNMQSFPSYLHITAVTPSQKGFLSSNSYTHESKQAIPLS